MPETIDQKHNWKHLLCECSLSTTPLYTVTTFGCNTILRCVKCGIAFCSPAIDGPHSA